MLSMAIRNWKEVTVFQTTEMGNCDPHVLVLFLGVARWNSCFSCECELCNYVCIHLFWICRIIRQWSWVCWINWFWRSIFDSLRLCSWFIWIDKINFIGWNLLLRVRSSSSYFISRLRLALRFFNKVCHYRSYCLLLECRVSSFNKLFSSDLI